MKESTQKEKVLKNVRDALVNSMNAPFDNLDMDRPVFFDPPAEALDITFAETFSKANGKFIYCGNTTELSNALFALLKERSIKSIFCGEDFFDGLLEEFGIACYYDTVDIDRCEASITTCEVLVSRLGSIVISSRQGGGRKGFISPQVHIVIASSRQLVPDIKSAFQFLYRRYGASWPSMITFVTGPGHAGDMAQVPVHSAQGPKDIFLFLLDAANDEK